MSEEALQRKAQLQQLAKEACDEYSALESEGVDIEGRRETVTMIALRIGRVLEKAKKLMRHGEWELWRSEHLPKIAERQDQRCRALARENPKAQDYAHLNRNSVRKFFMGYVPVKDRPKLDGDAPLTTPAHHLTVLNDWRKFCRRRELGLIKVSDDELRRDFQPLKDWLDTLFAA